MYWRVIGPIPAITIRAFVAAVILAAGPFLAADPAVAGTASMVIDARSGEILYAYGADKPRYPASLTKMMTLYMVFEAMRDGRLKPGQRLAVSRHATRQRPSRLGLRRGQRIKVEDAVLALVTKSANDVAVVLAEALAGSEAAFARRMTARARKLGMTNTIFRNASGLHHRGQLTTAQDMVRLATRLIRDFPGRYRYFSTRTFRFRGRRYENHNALLASYRGVDGIKTGFLSQAGYNLVASAVRGNRRLVGVVLGGETPALRDWRMKTLLDYGFARISAGGQPPRLLPYRLRQPDEFAPPRPAAKVRVAMNRQPGAIWAIQVGAYRNEAPAREAVQKTTDRFPALLANTRGAVTHVMHGGTRFYRARLLGMTEVDARLACRKLKQHRVPCLAVLPSG